MHLKLLARVAILDNDWHNHNPSLGAHQLIDFLTKSIDETE